MSASCTSPGAYGRIASRSPLARWSSVLLGLALYFSVCARSESQSLGTVGRWTTLPNAPAVNMSTAWDVLDNDNHLARGGATHMALLRDTKSPLDDLLPDLEGVTLPVE